MSYRRLQAPGLDELTGRGVYYGSALTEATACLGQDVYIVGGANSAGQAAVFLSRYAKSVTLLVRGASLEKSMSLLPDPSRSPTAHHHGADLHRGRRGFTGTTIWRS